MGLLRRLRRSMDQVLHPQWWLSEVRRAGLASVLGVVVALLVRRPARGVSDLAPQTFDNGVVFLLGYFAVYTAITVVVFTRAPSSATVFWARAEERGTWAQRYVFGTAPGPGIAIFIGLTALLVTLVWLPGTVIGTSSYAPGTRTVLGIALVVVAWIAMPVSFTVAYLVEDAQSGGEALAFPGHAEGAQRPLGDYAYFALAVSTTFGTTDVNLCTPAVRRTATVHAVVSFLFNTVVLAVVVSLLA